MNNVHEDEPVVFHTRWAMSYLRGPLTRDQIRTLTAGQREHEECREAGSVGGVGGAEGETLGASPIVPAPEVEIPPDVPQCFLSLRRTRPEAGGLVYRPSLLGKGRLHFVRSTYQVDHWEERQLFVLVTDDLADRIWDQATVVQRPLAAQSSAESDAGFAALAAELTLAKSYARWQKGLVDALYRTQTLEVFKCTELKVYSRPGESESDFRVRLGQMARERRDLEVEKLRDRYASKMRSLQDRLLRAQEKVDRERSDYRQKSVDTAISVGASIFGALFGRKKLSRSNVERASTSARRVGRVRASGKMWGVRKATSMLCSSNARNWNAKSPPMPPISMKPIERTDSTWSG